MRLFVAHFVLREENLWFSDASQKTVLKHSSSHYLCAQLFSSQNPEAAYEKAIGMVEGFSDSNHGGPGDLTTYQCIGMHQLGEVMVADATLEQALNAPYGIDVGHIPCGANAPSIASKSELLSAVKGGI